jgi:hypothetical protein
VQLEWAQTQTELLISPKESRQDKQKKYMVEKALNAMPRDITNKKKRPISNYEIGLFYFYKKSKSICDEMLFY